MVDLSKNYKPAIIIGIDPDVDRNGVATVWPTIKELRIETLSFAATTDYLAAMNSNTDQPIRVIIEAGWLNQSNWHVDSNDNKRQAAAKGRNQGRNEQVSRLLGEMCEHWGIDYEFVKPLKKIWCGPDRKITQAELEAVTGHNIRTNQEGRDAALLAWTYADLPVVLSAQTWKGLKF